MKAHYLETAVVIMFSELPYLYSEITVFTRAPVVMQICSLLRGGIGERGGVRVGHRIIEINGHSMVAMPHERIVHLLATSVGEVRNCHNDDNDN